MNCGAVRRIVILLQIVLVFLEDVLTVNSGFFWGREIFSKTYPRIFYSENVQVIPSEKMKLRTFNKGRNKTGEGERILHP
jgi:hypothetical protein